MANQNDLVFKKIVNRQYTDFNKKWYEENPAPDVEQTIIRDYHGPEYARQGEEIAVFVCIGIEDHRHKQKPEQESQQQRYEDVPNHIVNLRCEKS